MNDDEPGRMIQDRLPIYDEEYFENKPIGVESEVPEDETLAAETDTETMPWDPTRIRVGTKQFSLRNIVDLVREDSLDLVPDFQRDRVWKVQQRSRLIESILLQIPLPAFYFQEEKDLSLKVVDGLQRLTTVHDFISGKFALRGLEYLEQSEGKRFDQLDPPFQRRIYNSQIMAHVIDWSTPSAVKYDIYKRINTGGTPLNNQEIRHCMANNRSRQFLRSLVMTEEFQDIVVSTSRMQVRMADRELALRYCAFRTFGVDAYGNFRSIDAFLDDASAAFGDPSRIPAERLASLETDMRRGLANCALVFGDRAFRKWPLGSDNRPALNRTLFETWSTTLTDYEPEDVKKRREAIALEARRLMTEDQAYIQAITVATGDKNKLRYRFEAAQRAAEAGR